MSSLERKVWVDSLAANAAARELGWSYRHLWGYLKKREQELGRDLLHWDRGRAARLTEFAEKLLWAESRILARLAPQIENLAAGISRELTIAFDDTIPVASCAASHDMALPELRRSRRGHGRRQDCTNL